MSTQVTQSTVLLRVSTFPPRDVTMGSGSNGGNARVEIQHQFTFDDPTDENLPVVSRGTKVLYKYTDDTSDPPVTTSYSSEQDLVRAICDEVWYGSYTGSLDPPPTP